MQSVAIGWTAEERDATRKIAQNTQISWHLDSTLGNRTFTIGVSTIGGNDIIGINPGAVGSPGNYRYFDESDYVTSLAWERSLNMPIGGITKALAEVKLDNTSGRFTPRFMGGSSELFTAILPRRPVIINAGFNYGGIDQTIPQFAGVLDKTPAVDARSKSVSLQAADYIDYFQGRYLDKSAMFTDQYTNDVMATMLGTLGMNTAQYDLDQGINKIPFGMFEAGTKFSDIFAKLAQAENGHFFQDEEGIFRFKNRQWGDSSPYNTVQKIVSTSQVISAQAPSDNHLINVVEINSKIRNKQPNQILFSLSSPLSINARSDSTLFVNFDDPIIELFTPSSNSLVGNTSQDGTGTDISSSIRLKSIDKFAKAAKLVFTNNSYVNGFLTELTLYGRPAKVTTDLYYRAEDDSSVTAYQEHQYSINNDFIGNESWANSLAQIILQDFSEPENLQKIVIRAMPELQLFDLISWQGRYWRIFNIRTSLDPGAGFIQELTLLQRTITTYFRIGISTIGGVDRIAP